MSNTSRRAPLAHLRRSPRSPLARSCRSPRVARTLVPRPLAPRPLAPRPVPARAVPHSPRSHHSPRSPRAARTAPACAVPRSPACAVGADVKVLLPDHGVRLRCAPARPLALCPTRLRRSCRSPACAVPRSPARPLVPLARSPRSPACAVPRPLVPLAPCPLAPWVRMSRFSCRIMVPACAVPARPLAPRAARPAFTFVFCATYLKYINALQN